MEMCPDKALRAWLHGGSVVPVLMVGSASVSCSDRHVGGTALVTMSPLIPQLGEEPPLVRRVTLLAEPK